MLVWLAEFDQVFRRSIFLYRRIDHLMGRDIVCRTLLARWQDALGGGDFPCSRLAATIRALLSLVIVRRSISVLSMTTVVAAQADCI